MPVQSAASLPVVAKSSVHLGGSTMQLLPKKPCSGVQGALIRIIK